MAEFGFAFAVPIVALKFDENGGVGEGRFCFDDQNGKFVGAVFEEKVEGAVVHSAGGMTVESDFEFAAKLVDAGSLVVGEVAEFGGGGKGGFHAVRVFEAGEHAVEDLGNFAIDREGPDSPAGMDRKGGFGNDDPVSVAQGIHLLLQLGSPHGGGGWGAPPPWVSHWHTRRQSGDESAAVKTVWRGEARRFYRLVRGTTHINWAPASARGLRSPRTRVTWAAKAWPLASAGRKRGRCFGYPRRGCRSERGLRP